MKLLKNFLRRSSDVVLDNEVVPGTDKPTVILVGMIAAKMIQNPKGVERRYRSSTEYEWEFKDDPIRPTVFATMREIRKTKRIGYEDVVTGYEYKDVVIKVHNNPTSFDLVHEYEQKPLRTAFQKAFDLKAKVVAQEKENARQDAALLAIEGLTVKKPEPVVQSEDRCPHGKLQCDDSCPDPVVTSTGGTRKRRRDGRTEPLSPL